MNTTNELQRQKVTKIGSHVCGCKSLLTHRTLLVPIRMMLWLNNHNIILIGTDSKILITHDRQNFKNMIMTNIM